MFDLAVLETEIRGQLVIEKRFALGNYLVVQLVDVVLNLCRVWLMPVDEWPASHPVQPPIEWTLHAIGVARGELGLPPEHPLGIELAQGHGSKVTKSRAA